MEITISDKDGLDGTEDGRWRFEPTDENIRALFWLINKARGDVTDGPRRRVLKLIDTMHDALLLEQEERDGQEVRIRSLSRLEGGGIAANVVSGNPLGNPGWNFTVPPEQRNAILDAFAEGKYVTVSYGRLAAIPLGS